MDKWLRANGVRHPRTVTTNNLVALVGLTIAGLGISYMPRECFGDLFDAGLLTTLHTTPPLPRFSYVVAYQRDRASAFHEAVGRICERVCDFTTRHERVPLVSGSARAGSPLPRKQRGRARSGS